MQEHKPKKQRENQSNSKRTNRLIPLKRKRVSKFVMDPTRLDQRLETSMAIQSILKSQPKIRSMRKSTKVQLMRDKKKSKAVEFLVSKHLY